jgi:hypothetical protein
MISNTDKPPYSHRAPEGYFSSFNARLSERIKGSTLKIRSTPFLLRPRVWQSAAAIAVLAMFAELWLNTPVKQIENLPGTPDIAEIQPKVHMPLPDEYLVAVLQAEQFTNLPAEALESTPNTQPFGLLNEDDLLEAGLLSPEELDLYEPW